MFGKCGIHRNRLTVALSLLAMLTSACSSGRTIPDSINLVEELPDQNDYDHPPVLLKSVKPEYSPTEATMGISGKVTLKLLVLKDGTVGKIKVVEASNPVLVRSAVEAASKFVFQPATKNGRPKRATIVIPFVFKSG